MPHRGDNSSTGSTTKRRTNPNSRATTSMRLSTNASDTANDTSDAMNSTRVPLNGTIVPLNGTSGSVNDTSVTPNITSLPLTNQAMIAEVNANTAFAVKGLLNLQVGTIMLALIMASPLIFRHIRTGRYKKGWFLKRTSSNLRNMSIVAHSVKRAPNVPIGSKSSTLVVAFRNIYNLTLLKTIPWIKAPVGNFVFKQLVINCIVLALMYKNGPSPIDNLKRPGWMAASLLPLQFLLALKNSPLALIGKGHEKLSFLHQSLGGSMLIFSLLHGFIWLKKKITTNVPVVFKGTSLYGLVALVALVMIFLSSIQWVRSKMYQTFLVCHILGYSVVLIALWNHVPQLKPFVAVSVSFLAFDSFISYLKTSVRSAVFTSLPGGMTMIEIDRLGEGWKAGQFVYLRVFNGMLSFEKHPFTIVNAPASISPSGRNTLLLMVKSAGNFTEKIHRVGYAEAALIGDEGDKAMIDEKNFPELSGVHSDRRLAVAVEGPYGTSYLDMCDQETVILVAGGSGFTYCMSVLEHVVGSALKSAGITKKIVVSWSLRDIEMARVFSSLLNETLECAQQLGLEVVFQLYVTTPLNHGDINPVPAAQISPNRMDIKAIVHEALESTCASIDARGETRGCGVALGVCGPEGLVLSARQAVSSADRALTKKSGGLQFHSESFQL